MHTMFSFNVVREPWLPFSRKKFSKRFRKFFGEDSKNCVFECFSSPLSQHRQNKKSMVKCTRVWYPTFQPKTDLQFVAHISQNLK